MTALLLALSQGCCCFVLGVAVGERLRDRAARPTPRPYCGPWAAPLLALALAVGVLAGARPAAAGLVIGTGAMTGMGCNSHCLVNINAEPYVGGTWVDGSPSARPVTNTNATQDATHVVFGARAIYLDAATDKVTVPDAAAWDFFADFCEGLWLWADAYPAASKSIWSQYSPHYTDVSSTGNLAVNYSLSAGGSIALSPGAGYVPLGAWTHYEVCRSGTTARLYRGGVLGGTDVTAGGVLTASTAARGIGYTASSKIGWYDGYVVTSGGWAWSRAHTPPNRRW